jgi:hypothetical protein
MNNWHKLSTMKKLPKLKNPILVEGMPGIGNVGKVAVDFIIEELGAKEVCDIFSYSMPNSVFVNEDQLVDLPSINIYYKKGKRDLLLLGGDVQPIDEASCYTFSEYVLDIFEKAHGSEIIALGGIGLPAVPKKPKLYVTGNSKAAVKPFQSYKGLNKNLYGVVGPIMGVSGVLLGLAQKRNMPAVALLAETYGHPMYLGIKGAREIVQVLNEHLSLGIDLAEMDTEISRIEGDITRKRRGLEGGKARKRNGDVSYIG